MGISVRIQEVDPNENLKTQNMDGLSLNQMYRESGSPEQNITYKAWLESEKTLYNTKVESGKVADMQFLDWMQARWDGKLNAIGKKKKKSGAVLSTIKDIGKSVLQKTVGSGATTTAIPSIPATQVGKGTDYEEPKKTILGMKPIIFYSVAAVVALGVTFATIKIIQNMRK